MTEQERTNCLCPETLPAAERESCLASLSPKNQFELPESEGEGLQHVPARVMVKGGALVLVILGFLAVVFAKARTRLARKD